MTMNRKNCTLLLVAGVTMWHGPSRADTCSLACPDPQTVECFGDGLSDLLDPGPAIGTQSCTPTTVPGAADFYPLGTTTLDYAAIGPEGALDTCTTSVTVVDTTPPAILCPPDQTVECQGVGAQVDPGTALFTDACGASSVNVPGPGLYPLGTTPVVYTATDAYGNQAACATMITVASSKPPVLTASAEPRLWPPDHRYVRITPADCGIVLVDPCLGSISAENSGLQIESVTSDEPEDADGDGDGSTVADIRLVGPGTDKTLGPLGTTQVDLRAERQGSGNGRVYSIRYRLPATTELGGPSTVTCHVTVPQSLPRAAVDDGAVYTVSAPPG
jgi:HYR domain-containing protein